MTFYSWDTKISNIGSNQSGLFDPFPENLGADWGNGSSSASQSLVLDCEKGELVKAPGRAGKKGGVTEDKAQAALKSHSEAERRRRERINAHLNTLRGLVPCNEKMDKATLLAEVISEVKQLKKSAMEAGKGFLIPMDTDEVIVEPHNSEAGDETISVRATLCCDHRPELLSDLKQAISSLNLKIVKAEVSTLGGRVKKEFIFTSSKEMNGTDAEARQLLVSSVHQALNSIIDKVSASPEYSPRTTLPTKRRRSSYFDSGSSSS